jgi:hypothetical protein
MFRFIFLAILMIISVVIVYQLTNKNHGKIKNNENRYKWLSRFNKPIFKIPLGILIILIVLIGTISIVKVLPLLMKLCIILIDFVIIYTLITYLFNNKNK